MKSLLTKTEKAVVKAIYNHYIAMNWYLDYIEDEISRIFKTRIFNNYNRQHRDAVQEMIDKLKLNN